MKIFDIKFESFIQRSLKNCLLLLIVFVFVIFIEIIVIAAHANISVLSIPSLAFLLINLIFIITIVLKIKDNVWLLKKIVIDPDRNIAEFLLLKYNKEQLPKKFLLSDISIDIVDIDLRNRYYKMIIKNDNKTIFEQKENSFWVSDMFVEIKKHVDTILGRVNYLNYVTLKETNNFI